MTVNTKSDLEVVVSIAQRMRDPTQLKRIILDPNNKNLDPMLQTGYWSDLSIAGGYPGVLPLFTELDRLFPSENWDMVIHQYIIQIKESIESQGIDSCSMFGGLAGVCYAIRHASHQGTRYQTLLAKLDTHLIATIRKEYCEPFAALLKEGKSIPPRYYETIQGLAGIGAYLLTNLTETLVRAVLQEIVALLIALTRPIKVDGTIVPGWHVPSENLFLEEDRLNNPMGNFNFGLSHGITGVLSFLSIALMQGVKQEGQKEAIQSIVVWLQENRLEGSDRFFWPTTISFEEQKSGNRRSLERTRDSWCYGTPGITRSLYLAGQALQSDSLQDYAVTSFTSIFNGQEAGGDMPCPTFCHGVSGLLLITHLMAVDSLSSVLKTQVHRLKVLLLSKYSSAFPLGFKALEIMRSSKGFASIDRGDLLEGVSAILLTLLSLRQEHSIWHLPFLIGQPTSSKKSF